MARHQEYLESLQAERWFSCAVRMNNRNNLTAEEKRKLGTKYENILNFEIDILCITDNPCDSYNS